MKKIKLDKGGILGLLGLGLTVASWIIGSKQTQLANQQLEENVTKKVLEQIQKK